MSVDALRWALKVGGLSATEKLVLAILSDYAGEDALAYPRQSVLAERVGVSRQCVNKALACLTAVGLIEPVDVEVPRKWRTGNTGRFEVRVFQLHVGRRPKIEEQVEPDPGDRVNVDDTDRVNVDDTVAPAPCHPGLLDRVNVDDRHRVNVDDTAIRNELPSSELPSGTCEEEKNSHVSAAWSKTDLAEALPPPPPSRPRRVLQADLDRVASQVNEHLGLTGRGCLERDVLAWESIYRDCDGDAAEACCVAVYGRERCRGVGIGLTARSLAKNYRAWCAAAHQTTGGADVAAEKRAKRRQDLLGGQHA